eukprot:TRINITY_DN15699_c0_g1_i1.p1 TRINITY_DN15699_c0_g1~~TRINITY_DN15699_c0_g1_i1.p1  ORF type:complete len:170 (-),score=31.28 TRINITY_DN15699_c0_g1_i1:24-533(-)
MLWDLLNTKIEPLLTTRNLKLIVIDSIAALFRYEYTRDEAVERASELLKHAQQLKLLSDKLNVPILVVNQVSDSFYDKISTQAFEHRFVIPALGLSWGNCVHTRIVLKKTHRMYSDTSISRTDDLSSQSKRRKISSVPLRQMGIVLAPHLPNDSCYFVINSDGIRGVQT